MPRGRSLTTRERDARAVELRRRALTYAQIAKELGFRSVASAHDAVRRGIRDVAREDTDAQTMLELERLDELARHLYRVLATTHYAVAKDGKVILHPVTRKPLADDEPTIAAVAELRKVGESRRKLLGLDAPTKHRVEVVTEEQVDAEIVRLEKLVAVNGQSIPGVVEYGRPELPPGPGAG